MNFATKCTSWQAYALKDTLTVTNIGHEIILRSREVTDCPEHALVTNLFVGDKLSRTSEPDDPSRMIRRLVVRFHEEQVSKLLDSSGLQSKVKVLFNSNQQQWSAGVNILIVY